MARLGTRAVFAATMAAVLGVLVPGGAVAAPDQPVDQAPIVDEPPITPEEQSAMPAQVRDRIEEIQRGPNTITGVSHAEYQKVDPQTRRPVPTAYPPGCGLWVIAYKDSLNQVFNSSLTSCQIPVDEIQMLGGLSQWWGVAWWPVVEDEHGTEDEASLSLDVPYDCSGQGDGQDFRVTTNGYIELGGEGYQASAWDEIDNQDCGTD